MSLCSPAPAAAERSTTSQQELLHHELLEIYTELGVAVVQLLPSDDRIIAGHVEKAHALTGALLRRLRAQREASHAA